LSRRWLLFIPMYNCRPQITRTLSQLTPELQERFAEVFVVDNGSQDGGPEAALAYASEHLKGVRVQVVRNDNNLGLGGSHKVAFQHCLDGEFDGMFVFHGDDQGCLDDLVSVMDRYDATECVLGSRFMWGSRLVGYAPHRILANIAFNLIFSIISLRVLWDLGSGLNFYSRAFVARRLWEGCADDLTFNYHLILRTARISGLSLAFVPISWREEDQVSNAKLYSHGMTMLGIVWRFGVRRGQFTSVDHSTAPTPRTWTAVS
jgi:glycosyltransferase involved in cell wall biosynthesis